MGLNERRGAFLPTRRWLTCTRYVNETPHPAPCPLPPYGRYLHPQELELLEPTMVPAPTPKPASGAEDAEKATAEGGGAITLVPSSKKEASVRRRELLAYLREPLREACAAHAGELMRSKYAGASVLQETVRVGHSLVFFFFLLLFLFLFCVVLYGIFFLFFCFSFLCFGVVICFSFFLKSCFFSCRRICRGGCFFV